MGSEDVSLRISPSQNGLTSQVGIKSNVCFFFSLSFYAKNLRYLEKHIFIEFSDISFEKQLLFFLNPKVLKYFPQKLYFCSSDTLTGPSSV